MAKSKQTIVVFGATGTLGLYLIDYLVDHLPEDWQIVATGRNPKGIVKHLNQRGRHDRKRQPGQCRGDCFIQQIYMMRFHYFAERYSSMPLAPARPASIARITVAAPVTASPPA